VDSRQLIDAIMRQTTILVAGLSTAAGVRSPLAHVADQVFLDLAREIEAQGLTRQVTANMFGLALRTYQKKVQRLAESVSARNRTLWEAVYQHILDEGPIVRSRLEARFRGDSIEEVRLCQRPDSVHLRTGASSGRQVSALFDRLQRLSLYGDRM
jgi:hypothetical protein